MSEYREIMRVIDGYAHPDSERKYGTAEDDNMAEDAIRVTIIATGLKENSNNAPAGQSQAAASAFAHSGRRGYQENNISAFDEQGLFNAEGLIQSGREARNMRLSEVSGMADREAAELEVPAVMRRKGGSVFDKS